MADKNFNNFTGGYPMFASMQAANPAVLLGTMVLCGIALRAVLMFVRRYW